MDFYAELRALIQALQARGVEYALCGGVALAIHGVPRATQDIDLLLRPGDLDLLREVARQRGFAFEALPMKFASGATVQRFTKIVDGQPFMLDVLFAEGPFEAIWSSRHTVSFEGGDVQVVSRDGLISLKLAAGRPQDIADVQRLKEVARD